MLAKDKHHIRRKEHGPEAWGTDFATDPSISFRKIITMKMRLNLGHFGTKRVKYECSERMI